MCETLDMLNRIIHDNGNYVSCRQAENCRTEVEQLHQTIKELIELVQLLGAKMHNSSPCDRICDVSEIRSIEGNELFKKYYYE